MTFVSVLRSEAEERKTDKTPSMVAEPRLNSKEEICGAEERRRGFVAQRPQDRDDPSIDSWPELDEDSCDDKKHKGR